MTDKEDAPRWQLIRKPAALPGFGYGCRYPSVLALMEGEPLTPAVRLGLWECFRECYPSIIHPDAPEGVAMDWRQSVDWLLGAWQALQAGAGLPVYERGRILALTSRQARCVIPTLKGARRELVAIVQCTLRCLDRFAAGESGAALTGLREAAQSLSAFSPSGSNVPRFIRAAYEMGMPFQELPGSVVQFGQSSRGRWLESSFTDATPNISAKLARSKIASASLLRQAGLPVPDHWLVDDAEEAVRAAHHLAYPVVVKPADLDGGVGVAAGLRSDDEVRQAYLSARSRSSQILVEKHFEGRDYRVTVFNGEVIWAVERVPAGVTGDGRRTIGELVAMVNADPRRGTGQHAPLKRLALDDEAGALLSRQGMSEMSVPASGEFVRLRRAANVASGGTPVAVFDDIHPDNARLAVRAAEVLRLDLAGVDLLIPHVARSWRDTGAAICEVNGQPNLGQTTAAHLYAQILRSLVRGSGRVPVVLVLGAAEPERWLDALAAKMAVSGSRVGVAGSRGVYEDGDLIHPGPVSPYDGGKMLVLGRRVDLALVAINDDSILHQGLPFDRFDMLILAGANIRPDKAEAGQGRENLIAQLLASLLPSCDGVIITPGTAGIHVSGMVGETTATWHDLAGKMAEVADQATQLMWECVDRREHEFVLKS